MRDAQVITHLGSEVGYRGAFGTVCISTVRKQPLYLQVAPVEAYRNPMRVFTRCRVLRQPTLRTFFPFMV